MAKNDNDNFGLLHMLGILLVTLPMMAAFIILGTIYFWLVKIPLMPYILLTGDQPEWLTKLEAKVGIKEWH